MKLFDSDRLMLVTFLIGGVRQTRRALRPAIVVLPALMFVGMTRLIRRIFFVRIAPATSLSIEHLIQRPLGPQFLIDHSELLE